jgi:hypothetical protein
VNPSVSRREFWRLIWRDFGLRLPYKAITRGHSTPLDFVFDALVHPGQDLAVWANRSGLKTLSASIIAALEFLSSDAPLQARVLAGSEEQARNLYGYWSRWCRKVLGGRLVAEPGRLLTRLANGDFEILAASQKRVRGAKVQRLFRDEVDEIDPEVFSASVGMLASRPGTPARTIDTSTWHRADGPMGRLVAGAAERGIRLHKWNVWEALEQCPLDRHDDGRNCASCTLGPVCLAKAREVHGDPQRRCGIAAHCHGLLAIDDAIRQFRQWSIEQWQAEAECRRPALEGLVYPTFDRSIHVRPDLHLRADLPTWRSVDWGWNGFVCLWVQQDEAGCVLVVDEYCTANTTTADNARKIRQRHGDLRVEATFCDPAGRSRSDQTGYSDVEVFASLGLPCTYAAAPWAREIRNGINLIRSHLRPAAGEPRLLVAGRCTQLIEAFESYRNRQVNGQYIDEPLKPQACDHPMDALRYYFVNRHAAVRTETRRLRYT